MGKKKRLLLLAAAAAVLLAAVGCGVKWFRDSYVLVGGKAYPRNAASLDFRGTGISAEQYEAVSQALPDCEIQWDVPFQGTFYAESTGEIRVDTLTDEDVALLDYLPELKTVDARGCRDYEQLMALAERHPACEVLYTVSIDGTEYPQDTAELTITGITDEEIALLEYLPELKAVDAAQCRDYDALMALSAAYPGCRVSYQVSIAGETYEESVTELTAVDADVAEAAEKLAYLPRLQKVHLVNPTGEAQNLLRLSGSYPELAISWEMDVLGVTVHSDDTEADFSGIAMESTDAVAAAMEYFPNAEKVILCGCGIDNETLAAFRESKREDYKVVWSVDIGREQIRTDETYFMPVKLGLLVEDANLVNLRYCEDMICVDIGHMYVTKCDWAAYMPNLKYLVLADTPVHDLTPLTGLKNLIFLELFGTDVTDLSPLVTCTALEDLNLCYTYGDPEPIAQMTWLKRLWWSGHWDAYGVLVDALVDTQMNFTTISSTGEGWREGQNYYDMRDILGMVYMVG